MSAPHIRLFTRADRDQLTDLVNAHVAAVVPGLSVSVQAVLSQLERQTGEFVVDPWVADRVTLVAQQRGRLVAAAHLLRYGTADIVGDGYRGAGEIRWLLFWPPAPYWSDSVAAADTLAMACLAQFARWRVRRCLGYASETGAAPSSAPTGTRPAHPPDTWYSSALGHRHGPRHRRLYILHKRRITG
jgi:hypothetical protein